MNELPSHELQAWCADHLGSAPVRTRFRSQQISTVTGLLLADGREVVVKVRPPAARIETCASIQRVAWERGFPCPQLLVGPVPFGDAVATAEAFVPAGEALGASDAAALYARGLARLVSLLRLDDAQGTLAPSPYWMDWSHGGDQTWPPDPDVNLNGEAGPDWLDESGRLARERLTAAVGLPEVIGHGDWESQNLGWRGRTLHVVHDWDSVVRTSEAALAGMSSLMFPSTGRSNEAASIAQSEQFLDAYQQARQAFGRDESEVAWAAGVWIGAWKAKKAMLFGDTRVLDELQAQVADRMRRIGI